MNDGLLFIVSAPSGGGKTSLVSALVKSRSNLTVSISYTTRPLRPGERDGVDYHFVERSVFEQMIENDRFLEYAEVFDYCYGTSREAVEEQFKLGNHVVLEIDWQGARQIRRNLPDCVSIFVMPPSLDELRKRLTHRAEDNEATIERRMRDALSDISHYREYDYIIVNDSFDQALADLDAIVRAQGLARRVQQHQLRRRLPDLMAKAEAI